MEGEGWAPPFISRAKDTVGLYPPLSLRLLDYGKPLPYAPMRLPAPAPGLIKMTENNCNIMKYPIKENSSMLANRPVLVSTRTSAERFHGRRTGRRAIIN